MEFVSVKVNTGAMLVEDGACAGEGGGWLSVPVRFDLKMLTC